MSVESRRRPDLDVRYSYCQAQELLKKGFVINLRSIMKQRKECKSNENTRWITNKSEIKRWTDDEFWDGELNKYIIPYRVG